MKYEQVYDGDWVRPRMRGYRMKCCDCGLVHQFDFKVVREGKRLAIKFRPFRLPLRKKKTRNKK